MRAVRRLLAPQRLKARMAPALLGLALGIATAEAGAEVVVVVSVDSGVTALAEHHIADIFLGRMHRLPGGQRVTPIDQAEGSAVRDEFYASMTGRSPSQVKAHWAKIIFTGRGEPPRQVANSREVKDLVAVDPSAIGYIDRSQVDDSVRVLRVQ